MAESKNLFVGIGVAAGATLALHLWSRRSSSELPLPPSPKSYPLIGNALSMPQNNQYLGFIELGKQLGSNMFSLSMLGTVIIVLNSVEDAVNLLEKKSSIYSDRVLPLMLGDPSLVDFGRVTSLHPYDDRWRRHRRLIHPWLHQKAATAFHELQQEEARTLCKRLAQAADNLECSEKLYGEFALALARTIMRSIYGYRLESTDDRFFVGMQEATNHAAEAAIPANFLVNIFPFLRYVPEWLPGTGWKRTAREWREQQQCAVKETYNWAKSRIALGHTDVSKSIVASMINHGSQLGLSPEEIDENVSNIAFTLFIGGTETSANMILVLAIAMTLYPEIQIKAQEEIDAVVGQTRLPSFEDRPQLPYIGRLIRELGRWCPVFPTGIPHGCTQDDVYQGYRIPKGAMVISNIWAMSRDEKYYKDPERFDPDRFLDPSVPPCPVFGFGRRICPGMHYGEASVFIIVVSILSNFSFEKAKDENGNEVIPKLDSDNTLVYHPKPFNYKLKLRSAERAELMGVEI